MHVTAHGLVEQACVPTGDKETGTGKVFHTDEWHLDVGQHKHQVKSGCSSKFLSSCYWEFLEHDMFSFNMLTVSLLRKTAQTALHNIARGSVTDCTHTHTHTHTRKQHRHLTH